MKNKCNLIEISDIESSIIYGGRDGVGDFARNLGRAVGVIAKMISKIGKLFTRRREKQVSMGAWYSF
jgi:hypothetical protein